MMFGAPFPQNALVTSTNGHNRCGHQARIVSIKNPNRDCSRFSIFHIQVVRGFSESIGEVVGVCEQCRV